MEISVLSLALGVAVSGEQLLSRYHFLVTQTKELRKKLN
jgi:hypothetical protein